MQSPLPQPGMAVWIRGQRWRVAGVRGDGAVTRLDVTGAAGRRSFLYPFDPLITESARQKPICVRSRRARARLAFLYGRAFRRRTLVSAVDAHMAILPHQLEPALAAVAGLRRILIADEVGLGKTIEAGLIAAEILRRNPAARVLFVVPTALVGQWQGELAGRFNIARELADRAGLDRRAREGAFGDNPWTAFSLWMASLDFIKQPHVLSGLPPEPWDLVVVDEAHAACGRSDRHEAVSQVCRRSRCVVLLTATPHSGDVEHFTRLTEIGRLAGDPIAFFRRRRGDLGIGTARRVSRHHVALSGAEYRVFDALDRFERSVLRASGRQGRDEAGLLLAVLRKRALSTMAALARSIDRRLAWLASSAPSGGHDESVQPMLDLGDEEADDVFSGDDLSGLRARSGLSGDVERSWLQRLAHLVAAAAEESKVRRALQLLARTDEPAVLFTEYRDSLQMLVRRLAPIRTLAVLHGGMSAAERADALERFRSGAASVLVATDVAGQGLNLQHRSRWVISLELPWNPMRLEQRIGRVDRIGQLRPVHLTLLVLRHRSEDVLTVRLNQRMSAADHGLRDRAQTSGGRWARPACLAARQLETRRRLVRCWQGPDLAGRPLWNRRPQGHLSSALRGSERLLVFSIPFVDGTGSLVERHLSAVRSHHPHTIDEAAGIALAAVMPQLARARSLMKDAVTLQIESERALVAAMLREGPREAQPGLFDGAARLAFDAAQAAAVDLERELARTTDRLHLGADITAGRPTLEMVVGNAP